LLSGTVSTPRATSSQRNSESVPSKYPTRVMYSSLVLPFDFVQFRSGPFGLKCQWSFNGTPSSSPKAWSNVKNGLE
jgi:hypothetical protein